MSLTITIRQKIQFREKLLEEYCYSDSELKEVVDRWVQLFRQHHILIVFNEDPVDYRRRYAFISKVFLNMQLPLHPPGMYFCFIYDTLDGDTMEPEQLARQVLESVLTKKSLQEGKMFNHRVRVNGFSNLSEPELHYLLGRYQHKYMTIANLAISYGKRQVNGDRMLIGGRHETGYAYDGHCSIKRGDWEIEFKREKRDWKVVGIDVGGIEF
jgi:hypothetical protein